jgi:transaldolase
MAPALNMDAELNPAQRLHALGQSLWLDSINRVMLRTGTLARYVRDLAVTGLTSNPTILGHAMAAGSDYDRSLARLAGEGVTDAQDLVYALALEDLTEAAALFRPEWERTEGVDGYVSLEVPPDLAYDAAATVALARRLHDQAGFPNLLVKIPGTPQGLTALEETVTAGIGVNVTLLFSDTHYLRTADAYLRALERRRRAGLDLAVPSVASVFISRWDSAADPLLPSALHGSLGLAIRLEPDYPAAERAVAAAADAGIDADALAEHLQRHGAGAFTADWAALLTAIREKAAKLTQHA